MKTTSMQGHARPCATLPDSRVAIYAAATEAWLRGNLAHAQATGDTPSARALATRLQREGYGPVRTPGDDEFSAAEVVALDLEVTA